MKDKSVSGVSRPRVFFGGRNALSGTAVPILLLIGVIVLAYVNAWPNTLVLDDKLFTDFRKFSDISGISTYFVDHVWASRAQESGLYRPMLFVSLSLDANLFGDWFAGYHIVNIVLHALVTLLVYAFISRLLAIGGESVPYSAFAALLAAVLYGTSPMHTEVVNSVFNRSVMLAALGTLFGLWWLLKHLDSRPGLAWSGLFLSYVFALYSRETGIVLPGLAIALVLIYSSGSFSERVRRSLPVLTLLLPMVVYLAMRDHALSAGGLESVDSERGLLSAFAQLDPRRLLDPNTLLQVAGMWAEAFRVLLWPFDPKLEYPLLSRGWQWVGLSVHGGLLALAVMQYRRGRKGLLAGLIFFYISFLPASRLFGSDTLGPHLQERFLYLPAVGLAIVAAYGMGILRRRLDPMYATAPIVLALFLTIPVTWARNAEWADEIKLFEADYREGVSTGFLLRLLTAAHLRANNFERVIEICDANKSRHHQVRMFVTHCASALSYTGRHDEAVQAYLEGTRGDWNKALAHWNLAQHYMRQGRWDDARQQFEDAVAAEQNPARKAYRSGMMLVQLYPDSRERLQEARESFRQALIMQPHWREAQQWFERLNAVLGPATGTAKDWRAKAGELDLPGDTVEQD